MPAQTNMIESEQIEASLQRELRLQHLLKSVDLKSVLSQNLLFRFLRETEVTNVETTGVRFPDDCQRRCCKHRILPSV